MRKVDSGGGKDQEKGGEGEKEMITEILANIVTSQPHEQRLTITPTTRSKTSGELQ